MTTVDACSTRSDTSVSLPLYNQGNGTLSLYHHGDASPPTLHPVNRSSPSLFLDGMGSPSMFDGGNNGSPVVYHLGNGGSSMMFHSGNIVSAANLCPENTAVLSESHISDGIGEELLSQQQRQESVEFFQQLLDATPQRASNVQMTELDNHDQNGGSGTVSMVGQEHHRMIQLPEMDNEGSMLESNLSMIECERQRKSDLPPPPKKPLSPYMRFSKAKWQEVKASNPCKSVCEVGANVGRLWRDLGEKEKQPYIDEFTIDKLRYDTELLEYFERTGLQPEDLVKPRTRKKDAKPPSSTPRQTKQKKRATPPSNITNFTGVEGQTSHGQCGQLPDQNFHNVSNAVLSENIAVNGSDVVGSTRYCGGDEGMQGGASGLPSFSQVWSNQDLSVAQQQQLLAQMVHNSYQIDTQLQQRSKTGGGGASDDGQLGNGISYSNNNEMLSLQLAMKQQQQQQQQLNAGHSQQQLHNHQQQEQPGLSTNQQQELDVTAQSNWQTMPTAWQQQFNTTMGIVGGGGGGGGNSGPQPQQTVVDNQGRFMYQLHNESTRGPTTVNGLPHNRNLPVMSYGSSSDVNNAMAGADALEVGEIRMPPHGVGISNGVGGHTNNGFVSYVSTQFPPSPMVNRDAMNSLANGSTLPSVDSEILMLRNHLVEKSQEILELMKELEQAYSLIHQLKEQNNFISQQWIFHHQQQQQQLQQQQQQVCLAEQILLQQKSTSSVNTTGSS